MKRLVILGSTGSIGRQALEVAAANPDKLQVAGLAAGANWELLAQQAKEFKIDKLALADRSSALKLQEALPSADIALGEDGVSELAAMVDADIVLNSLVGFAGLMPSVSALEAGKTLALANKESLIAGGELLLSLAKPGQLIPVDSEHSAAYQCLQGESRDEVEKVILTASGGPFRGWSEDQLDEVTAEMALAHPTWQMGPKITIDSATLMNKGLEVIEAHFLFGLSYEQIEVWFHPQSYVHAIAVFKDGSSKAHLSPPDMRHPIQYALSLPERWASGFPRAEPPLNLEFLPCETQNHPALRLAYEAGKKGGTYPAVMSAANEVAVAAFLEGKIGFRDIIRFTSQVVEEHKYPSPTVSDLSELKEADKWARDACGVLIAGH